MARTFVSTTSDRYPYFLNGTPSSRRPWLFRKDYNTVDRILGDFPHHAYKREEAPGRVHRGVSHRGHDGNMGPFAGRHNDLDDLLSQLAGSTTTDDPTKRRSSVETLEVVGMGGRRQNPVLYRVLIPTLPLLLRPRCMAFDRVGRRLLPPAAPRHRLRRCRRRRRRRRKAV